MIIFNGTDKYAYRDPTCYFLDGVCHLFFTLSEKDNGYMYNTIAHSTSIDLINWSEPIVITPKDKELNYCSPGNIIKYKDEYIICLCSYPMPQPFSESYIATDDARLFTIATKDFKSFSPPRLLNPKSGTSPDEIGRMIDPFIIKKDGEFHLFFKQNGVSLSKSADFNNWEYIGNTQGGENACVIEHNGDYLLIHSPENGIAISKSDDLVSWKDYSFTVLNQPRWDWAEDRLTAAFAAELPDSFSHKYILFFHGSRNIYPETHGNATLAAAFTDDFINYVYEI